MEVGPGRVGCGPDTRVHLDTPVSLVSERENGRSRVNPVLSEDVLDSRGTNVFAFVSHFFSQEKQIVLRLPSQCLVVNSIYLDWVPSKSTR